MNKVKKKIFLTKLISALAFLALSITFAVTVALGDMTSSWLLYLEIAEFILLATSVAVFVIVMRTSYGVYKYMSLELELCVGITETYVTVNGKKYNMFKRSLGYNVEYSCVLEDGIKVETLLAKSGKVQGVKMNGHMAQKIG